MNQSPDTDHFDIPPHRIKAELAGHYYSNRMRLKFVGELEQRYRRYCSRRDRRYIANLMTLLLGLYIFYGVFDWYLLRDNVESVLHVRYVVGLPILFGVMVATRSRQSEPYLDKIVVFALSWLSFCTLWMASIVPTDVQGMYMASELVIVMLGLTITRMRFWDSVVAGWFFLVSVLALLPPDGTQERILFYYFCLSLGATTLCIMAQYGADRASRREFLQKQQIYKKNRELEKLNQKLKGLVDIDPLSGIANRRYFDQVLDEEWRRARRRGYNLAMLMCDIDFFKAYNDSLGHPQGDECIKQVAQCLKETARRPGDLVARYGGEEFAIILPALGETEAQKAGQIICDNISALQIPHPNSQVSEFVTISVGVASCVPDQHTSKMDLISWADEALYDAKSSGRNTVRLNAQTPA